MIINPETILELYADKRRLEARVAELEAVLREIADDPTGCSQYQADLAKAALKEGE